MDVIDRLSQIISAHDIGVDTANRIAESVRHEFQGELVYVPKRSEQQKESIQKDLRSGIHYKAVASKYSISERTALRWFHKVRRRKNK